MKHIITYITLFMLTINAIPGLFLMQEKANLLDHMKEVNKEWKKFNSSDLSMPIAFNSENERIEMHLLMAIKHLENNIPFALSEDQIAKRTRSLNVLRTYALDTRISN